MPTKTLRFVKGRCSQSKGRFVFFSGFPFRAIHLQFCTSLLFQRLCKGFALFSTQGRREVGFGGEESIKEKQFSKL